MEPKSVEQQMTLDQLELQLTRNIKAVESIFSLMAAEIAGLNRKLAEKDKSAA
jgi:hypothetical protein